MSAQRQKLVAFATEVLLLVSPVGRNWEGGSLAFLLFCEARAIGWPWRGNLGFISLELFIMSSVVEIMGNDFPRGIGPQALPVAT